MLARADGFADALAGTPLAVGRQAPLLLTTTATLAPGVLDEVRRVLAPGGTAWLLGGTDALAPDVEQQLVAAGFMVRRLAGTDRYETAAAVAVEGLGRPGTVLVATGTDFPDGLAAGAVAARLGGAVLLSQGDQPSAATDAYLSTVPTARMIAVGGPATRAYPRAEPAAGLDRFETAANVARMAPAGPLVGLATGAKFADALAGGAHAASAGGVLVLTPSDRLAPATAALLRAQRMTLRDVVAYGGTGAIAPGVLAAAVEAAR